MNLVTSFIKNAYHAYFGVKLGDQDKAWLPHIVCKSRIEYLQCGECISGPKGKKSRSKFGIPMVWREPTNHDFYAIGVTGINRKNQSSLKYLDLESAYRPVAHCDETQTVRLHIIEGVSTIAFNQWLRGGKGGKQI